MAEWLGTGLQNRLQQFDSAWYLQSVPPSKAGRYFYTPKSHILGGLHRGAAVMHKWLPSDLHT